MAKKKANKRLERLVHCGLCRSRDAAQYAFELKELARKETTPKQVGRQAKLFKALADSTRLGILKLLIVREMCVCELMTALGLTQPTTSHHLHILEEAKLVKSRRDGRWIFYGIVRPEIVKILSELNPP